MKPSSDLVTISVRVQPRASRNAMVIQPDGSLKIFLTAAPVKGAANEALVNFLSKKLDLPRRSFEIRSGNTGRNKLIRISGCNDALLRTKLSTLA